MNLVELANEKIDMADIVRELGVFVPGDGTNAKLVCPFEDLHYDKLSNPKSLRIYGDSNSAWCFVCNEYYTPVKVWAMHKDLTYPDAAQELLDRIGWVPPTQEAIWNDLLTEKPPELDQDALVETLKRYCARVNPEWETLQFDPVVSEQFNKCLEVLATVQTDQQIQKWLTASKYVMKKALGATA